MISTFFNVYLSRVDPLFKVVHAPLLSVLLLKANILTPAQNLLRFATIFTTVHSLHAEKCAQLLSFGKPVQSHRFQAAAEVLLSKCGLLITRNLTVLQAFAIYLVGLKLWSTTSYRVDAFRLGLKLAMALTRSVSSSGLLSGLPISRVYILRTRTIPLQS